MERTAKADLGTGDLWNEVMNSQLGVLPRLFHLSNVDDPGAIRMCHGGNRRLHKLGPSNSTADFFPANSFQRSSPVPSNISVS